MARLGARARTAVRDVWVASPRLRRALALLLVVELLVTVVLPAVVPRDFYLALYLNDDRVARSVESLFNGESVLAPDASTGWTNRPNVHRGTWSIDSNGVRRYRPVDLARNEKARIAFLGSSKINGGTLIDSSQMISSYLTGPSLETVNAGTMLYGPDQSYLAYTSHYHRFDPDVVVLGLDSGPEDALVNMYVPFRRREEVLMPFVKPRFELRNAVLEEVGAPLDLLRNAAAAPDSLLDFLATRDGFFSTFDEFRRFGFTPIGHTVYWVAHKLGRYRLYFQSATTERERLLIAILNRFRDELAAQHKQLVLVMLPDADAVTATKRWQPAFAGHQRLRAMLDANRFEVVDPRDALRAGGGGALFSDDAVHYTASGNKIVAATIAAYLEKNGPSAVRSALGGR